MLREITVATRLVIVCNPNNPTSTAVALAEIAGVPRGGAPARLRDPRRGLLRVQPARGPRRLARAARRATPTSCCCAPSRRSTACAGCASASRCAARRSCRARVDQVRQPFFCNAVAQAAAAEALAHQDAVIERVTRTIAERISVDERLRALGLQPADSQANFCWFAPRRGARRSSEVMRRPAGSAACSCAGAARSAGRARCASPTARPGERPLPGRARARCS